MKHTRRRTALVIVGVGVLGAGIWLWASVYPWHAEPDEAAVSAAWKSVEEAATFDPEATGQTRQWEQVGTAAAAARAALDTARIKPPSEWELLDRSILTAAEALMVWNDERGALASERCAVPPNLLRVFVLVQAGLASLHVASGPFVTAAQRLARLLRSSGSFLSYAVGMSITDELRKWAIRERVTPDESFRLLVPMAREEHAARARDAVCADATASTGTADDDRLAELGVPPPDAPWHARRFVDPGRERRMSRLFLGNLLTRCAALRGDLGAYEACTKVDRSALPKSVRVRATALQPPSFAAKVSDYGAFLQ